MIRLDLLNIIVFTDGLHLFVSSANGRMDEEVQTR